MKIKQTLIVFALMIGLGGVLMTPTVSADCGGVETSIINCNQSGAVCPSGVAGPGEDGLCEDGSSPVASKDVSQTGIWSLLELIIGILTAGIAVVGVGGVVYGSILYTSAGGSLDQTKQAKKIILNVALGLVTYALMYALINYLIPGGILG